MMEQVTVVSVVRDEKKYLECILGNKHVDGCEIVKISNSKENKGISARYNEFIDSFGGKGWLVFCHEDWKPLQNLAEKVRSLDPSHLYGPIGKAFIRGRFRDYFLTKGIIFQSNKDGNDKKLVGNLPHKGTVDSFDCQCLIVHSDLIRRYGLRFDEKLTFNLYVEDFCFNAVLNHGITSEVTPIICQHYSGGKLTNEYFFAIDYLKKKYSHNNKPMACIAGNRSLICEDLPEKMYGHTRFLIDDFLGLV